VVSAVVGERVGESVDPRVNGIGSADGTLAVLFEEAFGEVLQPWRGEKREIAKSTPNAGPWAGRL
jgi:hypothetical protein